ncbi:MAG: sulfatase-like hydrolase/transferase, partial [Armatimonadota bacterium]
MPQRPNVLLLVADTQRAHNLHCYGYERETSPTWDTMAAEGLLCEQNISPGIWSLPGYASMFTGTYVYTHRADADHEYVARGLPTLAEVLSDAGYQTCGLMPNTWGSGAVGLDRGFEHYVGITSPGGERWRGWEPPET